MPSERVTPKRSPYFRASKNETAAAVKKDDGAVPDCLDYGLRVLFVGINPGMTSSARQHHYAGPTNHFWPCLSQSGLVDRPLTYKDDIDLPRLYKLGFTNLSARATRRASDLTLAEQRQNRPLLTTKISHYRPRVACFVGKGIYEIYTGEKCNTLGLQSRSVPWENGKGHTLLFVMPSTSGIVAAYKKEDKLRFFKELCASAEKDDVS